MLQQDPLSGMLGGGIGGAAWMMIVPGVGLIGLGILVLVIPTLLELMVALAFFFVGATLVSVGLQARRATRQFRQMGEQFGSMFEDVRDGTPQD
jgi:Flp pilus assembly protein TadB